MAVVLVVVVVYKNTQYGIGEGEGSEMESSVGCWLRRKLKGIRLGVRFEFEVRIIYGCSLLFDCEGREGKKRREYGERESGGNEGRLLEE